MPRIATLGTLAIYIYGDDHSPPHFHARVAGREALIHIADLHVAHSTLSSNELREVLAWASTNKSTLITHWGRLN